MEYDRGWQIVKDVERLVFLGIKLFIKTKDRCQKEDRLCRVKSVKNNRESRQTKCLLRPIRLGITRALLAR
jgi:hypothetical protein